MNVAARNIGLHLTPLIKARRNQVKPPTNAVVVNAGSSTIPRQNTKVITKLTGLSGKPVASVTSLQLAYSLAGTQVSVVVTSDSAPAPVVVLNGANY